MTKLCTPYSRREYCIVLYSSTKAFFSFFSHSYAAQSLNAVLDRPCIDGATLHPMLLLLLLQRRRLKNQQIRNVKLRKVSSSTSVCVCACLRYTGGSLIGLVRCLQPCASPLRPNGIDCNHAGLNSLRVSWQCRRGIVPCTDHGGHCVREGPASRSAVLRAQSLTSSHYLLYSSAEGLVEASARYCPSLRDEPCCPRLFANFFLRT